MFTYRLQDFCFFAEADTATAGNGTGGGEGAKGSGKGNAGDKPVTQADLDALRSAKDKEVQAAKDTATQIQARLDEIQRQMQGDVVLARIEEELGAIDPKAEDAPVRYKDLVTRMANRLNRTEQVLSTDQAFARDQAASYRAALLVQEHGGDFDSYKAELVKAKTIDAMDTLRDKIDIRLTKENATKAGGDGAKRPSVDTGSGGSGHQDVVSEMNQIDPSTPEGLKKWNENRSRFLQQLAPARR